MERHWEMLRWIVNFMGENESRWREMNLNRKKDMEQREKEEQWVQKNREERIREIMEEEELVKTEKRYNKEERYKEAIRLKNSWREWRESGVEEEEWDEHGEDFLAGTEDHCWECVSAPCVCALVALERRIELLNLEKEIKELEEKKKIADEKVAANTRKREIEKLRKPEPDLELSFESFEPELDKTTDMTIEKLRSMRGELLPSPPSPPPPPPSPPTYPTTTPRPPYSSSSQITSHPDMTIEKPRYMRG